MPAPVVLYRCIDTMKESMDTDTNQLTAPEIANGVNLLATLHTSHITCDVHTDYPAYMAMWVTAIRATGKNVWFRIHPDQWENSYGVTGMMSSSQYVTAMNAFISANLSLFKSGDILDTCPEPENGKWWIATYGASWTSGAPNAATDDFNSFLMNTMTGADAIFAANGITGVITTVRSTNSWFAKTPQALYAATVAHMGRVSYDSYPEAASTDPATCVAARLAEIQNVYAVRGVPIILAEMGVSNAINVTDQQQVDILSAELNALAGIPYLQGINYWVGQGSGTSGGYTHILTGVRGAWNLRPAATTLSTFYQTYGPGTGAVLSAVGRLTANLTSSGSTIFYPHAGQATGAGLPAGVLGAWDTTIPANNSLILDTVYPAGTASTYGVNTGTTWHNEAAQFVSAPLVAGQQLGGTGTLGLAVNATAANKNYGQATILVINAAGALSATLMPVTSIPTNNTGATGTAGYVSVTYAITTGAYVTAANDRLVVELGGYNSLAAVNTPLSIAVDGTSLITTTGTPMTQPAAFLALPVNLQFSVTGASAILRGTGSMQPNPDVASSISYLRFGIAPQPAANQLFDLPNNYLLAWGDASLGGTNAGPGAGSLGASSGSLGLFDSTTGPFAANTTTAVSQFISIPLDAQTIPAMNWTLGLGASSSQPNWTIYAGIGLVNGATGLLKATIVPPSAMGVSRSSTLDQQCLYILSGSQFDAFIGDYLVLEIGVLISAPATEIVTVFADGATPVVTNGLTIASPQSYLQSALPLLYLGVTPFQGVQLMGVANLIASGTVALITAVLGARGTVVASGQIIGAATATLRAVGALSANPLQLGVVSTLYLHSIGATGTKPAGSLGGWSATNTQTSGGNALAMNGTVTNGLTALVSGYPPAQWAFGLTSWEGQTSGFTHIAPGTAVLANTKALIGGTPNPINEGGSGGWNWNFDTNEANYVLAAPAQFFFTIGAGDSIVNVTNGNYDTYFTNLANACKAWGKPVYFRFAHEMNGWWYAYGTGTGSPNGNTTAQYVAAWKHAWQIFQNQGAYNVWWVWCPNQDQWTAQYSSMAALYPGDAYVDYIGIDGYADPGANIDIIAVFQSTYNKITQTISNNKPLMICETGTIEANTYGKANYITNGFYGTNGLNGSLQVNCPKIKTVLWFNVNWASNKNYRFDTSTAATNAIRQVCGSVHWQGNGWGGSVSPNNHAAQFLSDPMSSGQALTGTWKLGFGFPAAGPRPGCTSQAKVWVGVINAAGTLVKTVLPLTTLTSNTTANSGTVNAWGTFTPAAYTTAANDRLVIEIGGNWLKPADNPTTVYVDGTTVIVDNSANTANASPQAFLYISAGLNFGGGGGPTPVYGTAILGALGSLNANEAISAFSSLYLHNAPAASSGTLPGVPSITTWGNFTPGHYSLGMDAIAPLGLAATITGSANTMPTQGLAQFISLPLAPAQAIGGTYSAGFAISTIGANLNYGQWGLSVIAANGTTQAVLVQISQTTAVTGVTGTYNVLTSGVASNYTTMVGDRLVLEIGAVSQAGQAFSATSLLVDGVTAVTSQGIADAQPRSFLTTPLPLVFSAASNTGQALLSGIGSMIAGTALANHGAATLLALGTLVPPNSLVIVPGFSTMLGIGTMPPPSSLVVVPGFATLVGIGTMPPPASKVVVPGFSTMLGIGSIAPVNSSVVVPGGATLAGIGTLVPPNSLVVVPGGATLLGVGTMSAVASVVLPLGMATLTSIGGLTAVPSLAISASATLSSLGSMNGVQTLWTYSSATLVGIGTVPTVASVVTVPGFSTLSGGGSLTALPGLIGQGGCVIQVLGSLTALAQTAVPGAATLVGIGSLAALPMVQGMAVLVGTGTLAAMGGLALKDSPTLLASGSMIPTATVVVPGLSTLVGTATTVALGGFYLQDAPTLLAISGLVALAQTAVPGVATLLGTGSLLPSSSLVIVPGVATLLGTGSFTPSSTVVVPGLANVGSSSSLSATGTLVLSSSYAVLSGTSALLAHAGMALPSSYAVLGGTSSLIGNLTLMIMGTATLTSFGSLNAYLEVQHGPPVARLVATVSRRLLTLNVLENLSVTGADFGAITTLDDLVIGDYYPISVVGSGFIPGSIVAATLMIKTTLWQPDSSALLRTIVLTTASPYGQVVRDGSDDNGAFVIQFNLLSAQTALLVNPGDPNPAQPTQPVQCIYGLDVTISESQVFTLVRTGMLLARPAVIHT